MIFDRPYLKAFLFVESEEVRKYIVLGDIYL